MNDDRNSGEEGNNPRNNAPEQTTKEKIHACINRFWSIAESHIPPPVNDESEAGKIRKHAKQEITFLMEIVGFFVAGAVAIAVLAQLVFTGCQLRSMNAQTAAMQGQLDEMQKDSRLDKRAWIGITEVDVENIGNSEKYEFRATF